jgi:hypothetical protein
VSEGMERSSCPVAADMADCSEGCEWFIPPEPLVPRGGCVIVLLFRELLSLRIPRRKAQA